MNSVTDLGAGHLGRLPRHRSGGRCAPSAQQPVPGARPWLPGRWLPAPGQRSTAGTGARTLPSRRRTPAHASTHVGWGGLMLGVPERCRPAEGMRSREESVRHTLLSVQRLVCSAEAGRATCTDGQALLPPALCPGQPATCSGPPVGWVLALCALQSGARKPARLEARTSMHLAKQWLVLVRRPLPCPDKTPPDSIIRHTLFRADSTAQTHCAVSRQIVAVDGGGSQAGEVPSRLPKAGAGLGALLGRPLLGQQPHGPGQRGEPAAPKDWSTPQGHWDQDKQPRWPKDQDGLACGQGEKFWAVTPPTKLASAAQGPGKCLLPVKANARWILSFGAGWPNPPALAPRREVINGCPLLLCPCVSHAPDKAQPTRALQERRPASLAEPAWLHTQPQTLDPRIPGDPPPPSPQRTRP